MKTFPIILGLKASGDLENPGHAVEIHVMFYVVLL